MYVLLLLCPLLRILWICELNISCHWHHVTVTGWIQLHQKQRWVKKSALHLKSQGDTLCASHWEWRHSATDLISSVGRRVSAALPWSFVGGFSYLVKMLNLHCLFSTQVIVDWGVLAGCLWVVVWATPSQYPTLPHPSAAGQCLNGVPPQQDIYVAIVGSFSGHWCILPWPSTGKEHG